MDKDFNETERVEFDVYLLGVGDTRADSTVMTLGSGVGDEDKG